MDADFYLNNKRDADARGWTQIFILIIKGTRMHADARGFTRIFILIINGTRMHADSRGWTWMYLIIEPRSFKVTPV